MARTFAGGTDKIYCGLGAMLGQVAGTLIALVRVGTDTNNVNILNVQGTSTRQIGMYISYTFSNYHLSVQWANAGSSGGLFPTVLASDGWVLLAAGGTAGAGSARLHKYSYAAHTFTHYTTNTYGDPAAFQAGDYVNIGGSIPSPGLGAFKGDIAAVAIVPQRGISDAEFERLPYSLNAWYALKPGAVILLDQSSTSQLLVDRAGGGSNQTSITGTSVSANNAPGLSHGGRPRVCKFTPAAAPTTSSKFFAVF